LSLVEQARKEAAQRRQAPETPQAGQGIFSRARPACLRVSRYFLLAKRSI
jgi:hypothetical protein